jgi:hypothetical protein
MCILIIVLSLHPAQFIEVVVLDPYSLQRVVVTELGVSVDHTMNSIWAPRSGTIISSHHLSSSTQSKYKSQSHVIPRQVLLPRPDHSHKRTVIHVWNRATPSLLLKFARRHQEKQASWVSLMLFGSSVLSLWHSSISREHLE